VVWRPSAEQQLAALWTSATDRNAVTAAANRIDADLARDPLSACESRAGNTRFYYVPPLAVYFNVDEAAREVTVWAVWRRR
jgi:hypothetical protein